MAPYEADSSDEDPLNCTTTNVLLGYASNEPTDDTISHLGGRPTWLDSKAPPSANLAHCKICNDLMPLLLQLHGDLPAQFPSHERRLHILGCRKRTCRRKDGSVRAIRSTRVSKDSGTSVTIGGTSSTANKLPAPEEPQQSIGSSLFGTNPSTSSSDSPNPFASTNGTPSNPFAASLSGNTSAKSSPFNTSLPTTSKPPPSSTEQKPTASGLSTTFAEKARLNSPPPETLNPASSWPPEADLPPPYPLLYLDADIETLDEITQSSTSAQTIDIDKSGGDSSTSGGKEDAEIFESTIDKTFQRFADRLAQNPLQVLRYEFHGTPLLYSKTDAVGKILGPHTGTMVGGSKAFSEGRGVGAGMPRCGNCGSARVFEAQLTPHAITELEAEQVGLDGMEWGTVIVGVCGQDCLERGKGEGEVGYVEEWVGVQWEELQQR